MGPAQHREKEQLERVGEIGRETRGRDKPIIASLSPPSSTSVGFLHSYAIGSFTQLHCPCTLCLVSQNINKSTNNFEARFYKTGRHTYSVQNGLSCVFTGFNELVCPLLSFNIQICFALKLNYLSHNGTVWVHKRK